MNKFNERLQYFQDLFGLQNWTILLTQAALQDKKHSAQTIADPRYFHANMVITPEALTNESAYDGIIVHELIHIVMALYDFFADNLGQGENADELFLIAREKSVSELTHIMLRLIK